MDWFSVLIKKKTFSKWTDMFPCASEVTTRRNHKFEVVKYKLLSDNIKFLPNLELIVLAKYSSFFRKVTVNVTLMVSSLFFWIALYIQS